MNGETFRRLLYGLIPRGADAIWIRSTAEEGWGKQEKPPSPDGRVCKELVAVFNLPQTRRLRPRGRM